MKHIWRHLVDWLLPVFLILFILEVVACSFAVGFTYAGRSENPDHTLTYTQNKLTWGDVEKLGDNGEAELSIFDAKYEHLSSVDESAVIAPGTKGTNIVRLKNAISVKIDFIAVLYSIKTDEKLPVEVNLADGEYTDTEAYVLPNGVQKDQMIRAVSGSVGKGEIVDFDISWLWNYAESSEQDLKDMLLGNEAAGGEADEITVGFYLVVEDGNEYHRPQTGDRGNVAFYICFMCMSGVILLFLIWLKKQEISRNE